MSPIVWLPDVDAPEHEVARAVEAGVRRTVEPVSHVPDLEHPSASSTRLQRAICGRYVPPRQMGHVDRVTCVDCRALLDAREALEL